MRIQLISAGMYLKNQYIYFGEDVGKESLNITVRIQKSSVTTKILWRRLQNAWDYKHYLIQKSHFWVFIPDNLNEILVLLCLIYCYSQ